MTRRLLVFAPSIFSLVISVAVFFSPHEALAKWEKIPSTDFTLPDPPDTTASEAEIDILLQFQNERSQEQCDLGKKQAEPSYESFFDDVPYLTKAQFQTLDPIMTEVSDLGERIAGYFKAKYKRTRPYNFDARIHPCVKPPSGAKSYPSSHATVAALDTCILAMVFPRWAPQYRDLGVELSERRLQIGVHFPSDVQAGQDLGHTICLRLQQESDFVKQLDEIKKQL